jgi:hypothetical protein
MDLDKHKPLPLTEEEIKDIEYQSNFEIIKDKEESKRNKNN